MKAIGKLALAATVVTATAAMAAPKAVGPVAVYWMSAQTSTGMMAAMMGAGGGRPSAGAMMGMMMRGGPDPDAVNHTLRLQLGSSRQVPGPEAEHDPPRGLGAGGVLPLVTPRAQPSQPVDEEPSAPREYQRPKGRMLIYWGCGEHAGPGQPVVIDFARMGDDPAAFAGLMHGLGVTAMQPPSPSRNATYGEWPNERSTAAVPADGSLVGEHLVRGDYTPDIRFNLGPDQDFMAPLRLVSNVRTPSGAVRLAWNPVPTALGYFATVMGAGDRGGSDTVVMWTSSATRAAAFAMPDYIASAEVRRLVASGQMMAPQTTQCMVPQEVAQNAAHGLVSMTAYGQEADFAYPARPAPTLWTVKVRYRSTTSGLLGEADGMGGGRRGRDDDQGQQQPPQRHGPFGMGGLGGFLP